MLAAAALERGAGMRHPLGPTPALESSPGRLAAPHAGGRERGVRPPQVSLALVPRGPDAAGRPGLGSPHPAADRGLSQVPPRARPARRRGNPRKGVRATGKPPRASRREERENGRGSQSTPQAPACGSRFLPNEPKSASGGPRGAQGRHLGAADGSVQDDRRRHRGPAPRHLQPLQGVQGRRQRRPPAGRGPEAWCYPSLSSSVPRDALARAPGRGAGRAGRLTAAGRPGGGRPA
jgi:hypothetical protein